MTTYRTGNNWGVTIVREAHDDPCPASVDGRCAESGEIHPKCKPGQCRYDQTGARRGQLVAVVVNGDRDLAEWICERLNAPTPDVPYTRGAREALNWVRHELDRLCPPAVVATVAILQLLDRAAAELGVPETAPETAPSATETAQEPSEHAQGCR